jgi:hypothetical protein
MEPHLQFRSIANGRTNQRSKGSRFAFAGGSFVCVDRSVACQQKRGFFLLMGQQSVTVLSQERGRSDIFFQKRALAHQHEGENNAGVTGRISWSHGLDG